jgi:uncharacterized protein (TIGR00369 family)
VLTIEALNERGVGKLPGFLGVVFTRLDGAEIEAELPVRAELMAPNGFLHAGSIITLADTSCGYGCFANLPQGATGFTTIELKSNHLGTTREGTIASFAKALHMGRNTHVWDAVITHKESNRTIALFRCTQMILYPK